ncbi:MAG: hypothetical protein KatS3mg003_1828 [Candidatus Nitrosocaldaceae archaeon]|nr:MAG: hypothetical protein KatS3mg003_1828 [Candidatus Nitrosocaldaceae archaeon]
MIKILTIFILFSIIIINIVNSYAVTNPLDRVSVDISITDLSGNLVTSLDVGSQVLISANIINKQGYNNHL